MYNVSQGDIMLSQQQVENITNAQKVILATASSEGWPRAIVVMPSRVLKDKIILSNIQMEKSICNLRANPKCFINVYIEGQDDLQYKLQANAEIFDSGELFEEIKTFEESENLPPELKVHSIIVANIVSVEETNG